MSIFSVSLLDKFECNQVIRMMYSMEKDWFYLGGDLLSLGFPLYQSKNIDSDYFSFAKKFNPILWQKFRGLYTLILNKLSEHLHQQVYFFYKMAIPGFHIFQFNEDKEFPGGSLHFDLSFQKARLPSISNLDSDNISFVLPLQLTSQPAGLEIWDFTYEEISKNKTLIPEVLQEYRKKTFIPYKIGKLNVITGLYWHRISPISFCYSGEQRITLQGHCTKINNRWIIFW